MIKVPCMQPDRSAGGAHRQLGQSLFEYVLLLGLIGLVLVTGENSPLEQLMRAIQAAYARHTYALALP